MEKSSNLIGFSPVWGESWDRSIFRKNIGRALLNKEDDPFLHQWEIDLTSRKAKEQHSHAIDFAAQQRMEQRVTKYIQSAFSFSVLPIEKKEQRLFFESRLISSISLCEGCEPSRTWLGNFSPKLKIRESGLWQVNELYKKPLTPFEWVEIESITTSRTIVPAIEKAGFFPKGGGRTSVQL